jgi:enamine deaminase RidA (YjgF/YER057c/UK114 family)
LTHVERFPGDPPSPYERSYGFSRIVRVGDSVLVGGLTSVDEDGVVIGDTPYEQTVEIIGKLGHELGRAGSALTEVVQTRAYVTDISRADDVGRAFGETFSEIRPLLTMIEVAALIDPRMLVEIEATALVRHDEGAPP